MRRYAYFFGALVAATAAGQAACSSSSSNGNNIRCGAGTTLDASVCYASETVDDASIPANDASDAQPSLTFGGAQGLAPASTTALLVTWDPSTVTGEAGATSTYRVYLATSPGGENYGAPTVTTAPGASSVVIASGLSPNTTYYVVVRAVDANGQEDSNTAEQSAMTQADTTPPTFAGVTSVASAPEAGLTVSWAAAKDDLTATPSIVYDVYVSTTMGGEDFNAPTAVSAPGATSITISGLALASATYYVVVRAVDAAGNVNQSPEDSIEMSGMSGADDQAPVFFGCTSATTVDAQSIAVTWQSATDNSTPAIQIAYDVFASTTPGGQDFNSPTQTFTAIGPSVLTGGLVEGLKPGTTYYLVCRARDLSGNEDQNSFVRVSTTAVDTTPPVFAGVGAVQSVTPNTAQLTWSTPATDNETATDEIVYAVYQSATAGGEVFTSAPVAVSDPGATNVTITNLASGSTYYWVVRAEDRAGNFDTNTVEISATTLVSFQNDVVNKVLAVHCAVQGCHVTGTAPFGLVMTPGVAYGNLVGVPVGEIAGYTRVIPDDVAQSYLYLKVSESAPPHGSQMPPAVTNDVLTPAQIQLISDWITQGALNN